jgi:ABC-2 type transport system ATP-binding protein
MLEVSNLCRSYGNLTVVKDVGFTVNKGEIVGLLGHNGAGKTTIMKMLSGYLEPDQGQVIIDGIDLSQNPKRVQQGLGYLPENLPVYPEMTVADYLDYAADLKGLSKDLKKKEIKRAIKATDLNDQLIHPIFTLSRGYKQRVGVAQAILGRPKLLILDEPTNGLDPTQTEHMRQLIRDIAKDATVLLSTHIMQEVDAICDRVFILNQGYLAVDAKLGELRRSNSVLLSTSMPDNKIQQLEKIGGLESVAMNNDVTGDSSSIFDQSYRLTLTSPDFIKPVCAAVAKQISKSGYDLYRLQPEYRDLETLFREVSDVHAAPTEINKVLQEVSHAA